MQDFDVILGMNLLSKYNVIIHCHKKKMVIYLTDEEKFKLIGDPMKARILLISALKEKKL